VLEALEAPDSRAVIICPSNPFLSIDPILAAPGIRERVERAAAPVIAVSPIIGGKAVKGPTSKIMAELDMPATSEAILRHYDGLLDGLVIDRTDAADSRTLPGAVHVTKTLMETDEDRVRLAAEVLGFADGLGAKAMGNGRR
jgi:LPPG:FO 2-phospho-L-lactate transferase